MYNIKIEQESLMPRERLVSLGAEMLSNQELLAILLRTGNKEKPVMELSAHILSGLDKLSDFKKVIFARITTVGRNWKGQIN